MGFLGRVKELTHLKQALSATKSKTDALELKQSQLELLLEEKQKNVSALELTASDLTTVITEAKATAIQSTEDQRAQIIEDANKAAAAIIADANAEISKTESLRADKAQLEKDVAKYTRQARKYQSDIVGIKRFMKEYPQTVAIDFDGVQEIISSLDKTPDDTNVIGHALSLPLHSENSKELKKLSTAVKKQVQQVLEKYDDRYTTKANKTIYKLMIMSLQAEIQLLLFNLTFESLAETKNALNSLLDNYLFVVADGNQAILPTETRFLAEIKPLYEQLIDIEYRYYVYRQKEKEEQRALREQIRQEADERKALEVERKRLDKEESKFQTEINRNNELLQAETDASKIAELQSHLKELEDQLSSVNSRREEVANLAMGKAGYVYVISNIGSFGDHTFKIGMTRRLEPQQRVDELGSASVPFKFDVHALIFSEDAVGLETSLHQQLSATRVNKVNYRKEFFNITIDKLQHIVEDIDPTAEFNPTMIAEEYRQSQAMVMNQSVISV